MGGSFRGAHGVQELGRPERTAWRDLTPALTLEPGSHKFSLAQAICSQTEDL